MRLADHAILNEQVLGDNRLISGHLLQFDIDRSPKGVKELRNHDIVAHFNTSVDRLSQPTWCRVGCGWAVWPRSSGWWRCKKQLACWAQTRCGQPGHSAELTQAWCRVGQ